MTVRKITIDGTIQTHGVRFRSSICEAIMLPHDGSGGLMLNPNRARPPSITITVATPSSEMESMAGTTLGSSLSTRDTVFIDTSAHLPKHFPERFVYWMQRNLQDKVLYASDYPHWDFDLPSTIYDLPWLSEKAKHNILGGTAAKLFKLPPRNAKQEENLKKYGNLVTA